MTQYTTFNVELSKSRFNKLKSGIKSRAEATLNIAPNLIWNSKMIQSMGAMNTRSCMDNFINFLLKLKFHI